VCQIRFSSVSLSSSFLIMSSKSKSAGVFNVDSISTERLFRRRAQYLVSWEGHDDVTWEYAAAIEHTPAFATYMRAKKKRIVSIAESRTHEGVLQYRVSYPARNDIWEPASFVKGTKALKDFRALQSSGAAESESIASSEERSTSTPPASTSASSISASSIPRSTASSLIPPSISTTPLPTARRVAAITNHGFHNSGGVEYLVTWTTGEQTWEHSEVLNLSGGETPTGAYISSLLVDADPLTVLSSRHQAFANLGTQLRRLHPFLSSNSEAHDQFRVCTSLWKLTSMLSHQAFLAAGHQTNATSEPSTPATSSSGPALTSRLHSSEEYRAFSTNEALDLVRRGCDQEVRELVAARGIEWLNKCRDRFGWGAVHYAAAGSKKSPKHTARLLQWLYEHHATMNQVTALDQEGVPADSTCLHVAVARGQLECVHILLQVGE
jgi:hypothetical protein